MEIELIDPFLTPKSGSAAVEIGPNPCSRPGLSLVLLLFYYYYYYYYYHYYYYYY